MGRKLAARLQDALDRAQDVAYDAWEASGSKRRVALAEEALAISPLCADAYVILAEHAKRGSDKQLDLWRRGVEAGEKALGKAAFEQYAGEFWGFVETRPYMRARLGLAEALWARGLRDEAIDHLRELLRLNPNDNQGARYILAAHLLETERDKDLAVLLEAYPDDAACAWSFTAALASFRRTGDSEESRTLLSAALADNPHVPTYLLGERPLPKSLPPYIGFGDKDEAIYYAVEFSAGWENTSGAIDWLRSRVPASKRRRPRSPKRVD